MTESKRLYYLDNLRVAVIILVIAHHVGQAYGPTGGWWPIQEATRAPILGPFFTVNRSFPVTGHFIWIDPDYKSINDRLVNFLRVNARATQTEGVFR